MRLTWGQEGFARAASLDELSPVNLPVFIDLSGDQTDSERDQVLEVLERRHQALRLRFAGDPFASQEVGGGIRDTSVSGISQIPRPPDRPGVEPTSLTRAEIVNSVFDALGFRQAHPLWLHNGWRLVNTTDRREGSIAVVSHLAVDGYGAKLIADDFVRLTHRLTEPLAPVPTVEDIIAFEDRPKSVARSKRNIDRIVRVVRESVHTGWRSAQIRRMGLDVVTVESRVAATALSKASARLGVSRSMLAAAILAILVSQEYHDSDCLIGLLARPASPVPGTVSALQNSVATPALIHLDTCATVREWLRDVVASCLVAYSSVWHMPGELELQLDELSTLVGLERLQSFPGINYIPSRRFRPSEVEESVGFVEETRDVPVWNHPHLRIEEYANKIDVSLFCTGLRSFSSPGLALRFIIELILSINDSLDLDLVRFIANARSRCEENYSLHGSRWRIFLDRPTG